MKHTLKFMLLVGLLSGIGGLQAQTTSTSTSDSASTASGNASGTNTGTNTNTINFPSGPEKSTVEYKGSYTMKTTPTIYAPPLVTTMTDTCMGSSSLGASFSGFGLSGGTTWTDKNCVRRLDAREFRAMGMNDVAIALLCQNAENQKAVEATGRNCHGMTPVASTVAVEVAPPTAAATQPAVEPVAPQAVTEKVTPEPVAETQAITETIAPQAAAEPVATLQTEH